MTYAQGVAHESYPCNFWAGSKLSCECLVCGTEYGNHCGMSHLYYKTKVSEQWMTAYLRALKVGIWNR